MNISDLTEEARAVSALDDTGRKACSDLSLLSENMGLKCVYCTHNGIVTAECGLVIHILYDFLLALTSQMPP